MTTVCLSLFASIQNTRPTETAELPLSKFVEYFRKMSHTPIAGKMKASAFTLCCYKPEQPRKKENIVSVHGIVLDIDEAVTIEALGEVCERLGETPYVLYSTYSSQPDQYKLRLILPLDEPVTTQDYEEQHLALRAAKLIQLPIDSACQQPAQLYFLPSCKPDTEDDHVLEVNDAAKGWSLDDLPELEDGDHGRFLSKPAQSSRAAKQTKRGSQATDTAQLVQQVVQQLSPFTDPICAEGRVYFYQLGYWIGESEKMLLKKIMNTVFPGQLTVRQAKDIVEHMMTCYARETFPYSPWLEKGSTRTPLIALENGTLNPLTGKMVKQKPEHYLRSVMDYPYDQDATCPQWLEFLDSVFATDADKAQKIALLQEFMGYLLIPSTRYQKMLWMVGRGSNGKSVINEVIGFLLGANNVSSIPLHRLSQRFQAAELIGKLANLNDELPANVPLQDDLLKQAVAGNLIQGERKGKDPFYFAPHARFVVAMNQLPRVHDTSHGFFRRVLLLPFNRVIQPHEQDRDLVDKLHGERAGILVWATEGLQRLLKNDTFTEVPSSISALEEFKQENNPVELFCRDIIILEQDAQGEPIGKILIADVYQLYRDYCGATGCHPLGSPRFGRELAGLGIQVVKSNGKRYYRLKTRTLEDAGVLSTTREFAAGPRGPRLVDINDELRA